MSESTTKLATQPASQMVAPVTDAQVNAAAAKVSAQLLLKQAREKTFNGEKLTTDEKAAYEAAETHREMVLAGGAMEQSGEQWRIALEAAGKALGYGADGLKHFGFAVGHESQVVANLGRGRAGALIGHKAPATPQAEIPQGTPEQKLNALNTALGELDVKNAELAKQIQDKGIAPAAPAVATPAPVAVTPAPAAKPTPTPDSVFPASIEGKMTLFATEATKNSFIDNKKSQPYVVENDNLVIQAADKAEAARLLANVKKLYPQYEKESIDTFRVIPAPGTQPATEPAATTNPSTAPAGTQPAGMQPPAAAKPAIAPEPIEIFSDGKYSIFSTEAAMAKFTIENKSQPFVAEMDKLEKDGIVQIQAVNKEEAAKLLEWYKSKNPGHDKVTLADFTAPAPTTAPTTPTTTAPTSQPIIGSEATPAQTEAAIKAMTDFLFPPTSTTKPTTAPTNVPTTAPTTVPAVQEPSSGTDFPTPEAAPTTAPTTAPAAPTTAPAAPTSQQTQNNKGGQDWEKVINEAVKNFPALGKVHPISDFQLSDVVLAQGGTMSKEKSKEQILPTNNTREM